MPSLHSRLLPVSIILSMLTACGSLTPEVHQPYTAKATLQPATVPPEPTHTATQIVASINTPTSLIPTPLPTSELTPTICAQPRSDSNNIILPDLSTLRWESLRVDGQRVRQLTGLDYSIIPFDPSPNGRWLIIALELVPSTGRAATAVIDTRGDTHWWMNTITYFFADYFVDYPHYLSTHWLPDGRLLWVNESHKVLLGGQQDRHDLGAPEPIDWVEYMSDGIAFAQDEDGDLWRVELATARWEQVTAPRPREEGPLGHFFIIAQDRSYALSLTANHRLWRIPIRMGASPEALATVGFNALGRGGPSGPPSVQLANSPYWLMGEWSVIVNERDGSFLTPRDIRLPEGYHGGAGLNASPDGRWLAIPLTSDPLQPWEHTGVYIAPATNLAAGRVIKGVSVVGWHITGPAVVLRNLVTGALSVARLPLTGGTTGAALADAAPPLIMLPTAIVAMDARSSARVLQFDLDGHLLKTLDLAARYKGIRAGIGATDRVFLSAVDAHSKKNGMCTYALIEWTVGP